VKFLGFLLIFQQKLDCEVIMDNIEARKPTTNTEEIKMKGKNVQELYDNYIRKGDEAIISEDFVLAEKYYQYADHYLRLMNDPHHFESDPEIHHLAAPHSIEELIGKALKGIMIERATKNAVIDEKAIQIVKAAKAVKTTKKEKAVKTKSVQRKPVAQTNGVDCKKRVRKNPKIKDMP
jgi:hypothetical protein